MKGKLLFIAGIGVGYVLGARAGRQSYEKLRTRAQDVWTDPKVQKSVHDAGEFVKDKAPVVGEKIKDAASSASSAVRDKVSSSNGVGDRVSDAADTAADKASAIGDKAAGAASDLGDKASDAADSGKSGS